MLPMPWAMATEYTMRNREPETDFFAALYAR
jgi:hypothetical protein